MEGNKEDVQVMLFHLIWGEAANLRLVPEYLSNPDPDPSPNPGPDH